MKSARLIPLLAGIAVAVMSAMFWTWFFEVDSCLDAGGRYDSAAGGCVGAPVDYVALSTRPGLYLYWLLFLTLTLLPAILAHWVAAKLLRRFHHA